VPLQVNSRPRRPGSSSPVSPAPPEPSIAAPLPTRLLPRLPLLRRLPLPALLLRPQLAGAGHPLLARLPLLAGHKLLLPTVALKFRLVLRLAKRLPPATYRLLLLTLVVRLSARGASLVDSGSVSLLRRSQDEEVYFA
jgi:hypothetical protein